MRFPSPEFDDAVAAACDGTADEACLEALGDVLVESDAALDTYLLRTELHATLASTPQFTGSVVRAEGIGEEPLAWTVTSTGRTTAAGLFSAASLGWWMAAVACSVAMLAYWSPRGGAGGGGTSQTSGIAAAEVTAMLVDEAAAVFALPRLPGEVRFDPGKYELLAGTIHLRYVNGADLIIEGPARFEIHDALHTVLKAGRVRAIVPPTAHGFTVATREVAYEDVGTEFGLSVDAITGESRMRVFDGKVNLRNVDAAATLLRSVDEGGSVGFRDGRVQDSLQVQAGDFPLPGAIGHARWSAQREQRLGDPALMAWFPFVRGGDPAILANAVPNQGVADGRIVGARWATGRWPGKQSLWFDSEGDFVEIDIPGEYAELTVAAWLKVDRFEHEMSAILNSNGKESGGLHIQFNRLGLPRGGLLGVGRPGQRWLGNPVPIGKWVHVVSVTSVPKKRHVVYVNGLPVLESGLTNSDVLLKPGRCRLGNWLSDTVDKSYSNRSLHGLVDELSIWNRALSAAEVSALTESGRPSLLWTPDNPGLKVPMPTNAPSGRSVGR
jgi:hypothetical protein